MSTIDFIYNEATTTIQCNDNDKIEDIIQKFCKKINKNKDSLYFIYGGNILEQNLSFEELANKEDKKRKKITILTNDIIPPDDSNIEQTILKKSKYIICPKCKENIGIKIKDFKIQLYDCKNGHIINNLSFLDFEESQMIDESKIICDICQDSNKSKTYQNSFYICFSCKKNICPLCKMSHDNNHILMDYSQKDFKCNIHNELNNFYCIQCKKDICILCEKDHINHNKKSLGEIMPDKKKLEENKDNLKKKIEEFEKDIQNIIKIFNDVIRNIQAYYNIYDDIITAYEIQNRNYRVLQNINDINNYNDTFIKDLNKIIENSDIKSKFEKILNVWNEINHKEESQENKNEIKKEKEVNSYEKLSNLELMAQNLMEVNLTENSFNIEYIKKVKSYKRNKSFDKAIYLSNKKIILFSNKGYLAVYDLQTGKNFYKEIIGLRDIIKLNDENLILAEKHKLKLIKVNDKDISIIQELDNTISRPELCLLSSGKILLYENEHSSIHFYSYVDNKLISDNYSIKGIKNGIRNICEINKNELAIIYWEYGKIYGYNDFLVFYDLEKKEIIKTIDINGDKLCLLNKYNLIVISSSKICLVDLTKRKIINKISSKIKDTKSFSVIEIDENTFIVVAGNIYQYEIEDDKIKFKGSNLFSSGVVAKLPDNQLLVESFGGLDLYEY